MLNRYNLLRKNSKTKWPIMAEIIAIKKLLQVKISSIAHNKPLALPKPECSNSPIKRFE